MWHIKHASERGIEIISEASRYLPDSLKELTPEIPWRRIGGVGNVLRHGYEKISDRVVWDIIVNHLPLLGTSVRRLLREIENDGQPGLGA